MSPRLPAFCLATSGRAIAETSRGVCYGAARARPRDRVPGKDRATKDIMTTLRTTAIMETDISGSTVRFRALGEEDLHALLIEHRGFLVRHAAAHDGRMFKSGGRRLVRLPEDRRS